TTTKTTTTGMSQTVGTNGIATPLPTQSGMVGNCNKFVLVNPGDTCNGVAFFNGPVSTEEFVVWNGGVGGMACTSLQAGTYACIGVTSPVSVTPSPTAVVGANGVATPIPTQAGMVANCNKFVKINPGDTCNGVAFFNGPISTENFVLWNTGVGGMACTNLQAGTFGCIGVIAPATPTASVGPNGVTTPLPIQTGMVTNCKKFVKVNPGDTCNIVAFYNGPISTENFVLWNGGVGGMTCNNLQANTLCVHRGMIADEVCLGRWMR
ncbi:carbohydrate-binding module family 50 protein, partial [Staphylotrichum tortipilum]